MVSAEWLVNGADDDSALSVNHSALTIVPGQPSASKHLLKAALSDCGLCPSFMALLYSGGLQLFCAYIDWITFLFFDGGCFHF